MGRRRRHNKRRRVVVTVVHVCPDCQERRQASQGEPGTQETQGSEVPAGFPGIARRRHRLSQR
jgi:hypothetical protein